MSCVTQALADFITVGTVEGSGAEVASELSGTVLRELRRHEDFRRGCKIGLEGQTWSRPLIWWSGRTATLGAGGLRPSPVPSQSLFF